MVWLQRTCQCRHAEWLNQQTPANVRDAKGFNHVKHTQVAVNGDKNYCIKPAREVMEKYGLHDVTVKLNHMKDKSTL